MIIQYNMVGSSRDRQLGRKLFFHWQERTVPTDQEVVDVLEKRYMNGLVLGESTNNESINITLPLARNSVHAVAYGIFCSYENGLIADKPFCDFDFDRNGWYSYNPSSFADWRF